MTFLKSNYLFLKREDYRNYKKKVTAFCTSEKIQKFRRPKISFFGIFSYQVIISGSKIDNFGARKSAHPAMYHSTIPIHFSRSSLRTDRQTNKQKDMLILLIYKTRASPVDGHSCSPSPIPVLFPVRNPRLYFPSPCYYYSYSLKIIP